ncbi:MAG: phosphohistidine phosphatase SixA [Gemmataceae bacterium]|nr:phosphohistidine phosphatase SixA [Gemmataceae bacterium]
MELFLIRHAEAIELGEQGVTCDDDRPLTPKGEQQAQSAAKALASRGIVLDKIYTSPLLRAKQTAEIMLATWAMPELSLELCEELRPSVKPRKLCKSLIKCGAEKIAVVGHMPHLGEFAGWLLGDKEHQIELAKAGVAYLTCRDRPGKGMAKLRWLVTPDWY